MADKRATEKVTLIRVKVAAGASTDLIRGWNGDCLRLSLVTAAERGKANAALIKLLARALNLPKSAIAIAKGERSAQKTLAVTGLSEREILMRLGLDRPGE